MVNYHEKRKNGHILSAPINDFYRLQKPQTSDLKAVIFDLFDTLLLIGEENEDYARSLRKFHDFLYSQKFNCSQARLNRVFFDVVDKINRETSSSLEEPHFRVYVSRIAWELGYVLPETDPLISEAVRVFYMEFKHHLKIDKSAFEVLESLQKKYKLGLISNLTFSECAWELLDEYNLKNFFETILVSGDINVRKPSPEIFKKALSSLGVTPSQAIFVGDNLENDIRGSVSIGMRSIHIRRGIELSSVKPDFTINQLKELISLL